MFVYVADEIWRKINDIIIKTLISLESKVMAAMDMFVPYPGWIVS
jgi:hypothetical protein